jgi:hypothetical protein
VIAAEPTSNGSHRAASRVTTSTPSTCWARTRRAAGRPRMSPSNVDAESGSPNLGAEPDHIGRCRPSAHGRTGQSRRRRATGPLSGLPPAERQPGGAGGVSGWRKAAPSLRLSQERPVERDSRVPHPTRFPQSPPAGEIGFLKPARPSPLRSNPGERGEATEVPRCSSPSAKGRGLVGCTRTVRRSAPALLAVSLTSPAGRDVDRKRRAPVQPVHMRLVRCCLVSLRPAGPPPHPPGREPVATRDANHRRRAHRKGP